MARSIVRLSAVNVIAACCFALSAGLLVGPKDAIARETISRDAGALSRVRGHEAAGSLKDFATQIDVGDSSDVAATVDRFHAALLAGDSIGALALLADDVVILESGGVETREEYRSHHLPGDIAFAQAVPGKRGPMTVRVRGDVAWVTATSITQGDYRSRPINSAGVELMVLSRQNGAWTIRAIHWSSRSRRPAGG